MSGGTKQNGQTNPGSARSSKIKTLAWRYLPAISMLVSLSVSPSTAPLTVTWWPACSATLSCASTTYTFLSASFTNTYLAPCSLTHLVVHSPALSFAPFTPHWLSEIQPVHELSAAIANAPARSVAAIATANRTFMISPSRTLLRFFDPLGRLLACHRSGPSVQTLPTLAKTFYGVFLFPVEQQQKKGRIHSGILPCRSVPQGVGAPNRTRLLPGRRGARRSCSGRLRHAHVARGGRFGHLVDHQFDGQASAAGVEEDRFVHRAILLFEAIVIRQDVDGIAILLGVGVLQLDLNGADLSGPALALHGELEVIALSHATELIDFIVVPRDKRAHLAARHLNAALGGVQVGPHTSDVAVQLVHVIGVGLGGQFGLHGGRQVGHLLVDRGGGVLVLFACGDEYALSYFELVGDNSHVTLQLLVDFVGLGLPLGQRFVGLPHGLCRLLDALGLIQGAPAYPQAEQ